MVWSSFTEFYRVLPGFTGFYLVFSGVSRIITYLVVIGSFFFCCCCFFLFEATNPLWAGWTGFFFLRFSFVFLFVEGAAVSHAVSVVSFSLFRLNSISLFPYHPHLSLSLSSFASFRFCRPPLRSSFVCWRRRLFFGPRRFLCFALLYWVLPSFTGFYWVFLGFT